MRHLYEVDGWGVGEVWLRDGLLVQHELASQELARASAGDASGPAPPMGGAKPPTGTLAGKVSPVSTDFVPDLCRRFAVHLAGGRVGYDEVVIDLEWATPFQRALAATLRSVPWGEVLSYGELAALAGRPGAARAAGSFCADNRYPLIVPCHRVVAAGGIGGYGASGVALKRRLLALEGVSL